MNKEEILIAIKEIQCRYSLPALEKKFTDKDYACIEYEKLAIHLANQQIQKDKKIEKLNKIIDELEKTVEDFITNHTKQYLDWKYDEKIYNAETNVLSKLHDKIFDKLTELKKEVE